MHSAQIATIPCGMKKLLQEHSTQPKQKIKMRMSTPKKKNKQIQATANRGGKKTREIRNAHNNCVTVATICKMLNIPCPHPNNMNAFMPRRHFSFATTKRTSLT